MIFHQKRSDLFLFVITIALYILAWKIQTKLFLNWDVSQLLHVTEQMLNGGKYGIDFFTPNPPMILYLYTPPLWISKLLTIHVVTAMSFYFFILTSISLLICYSLLKKITHNKQFSTILTFAIAVIFLIVPAYNFGQRDTLLVIFTLPYLLGVACRLSDKTMGTWLALFIGILASAGLALKPHFLLLMISVETYYAYQNKSLFSLIRVETLTIFSILVIYALVSLIFYPEFFNILTPFLAKHYYSSNSISIKYLLLDPITLFSSSALLVGLLALKQSSEKIILRVLIFGLIGAYLVFFSQMSLLSYHKIPPLSLAILLIIACYNTFSINRFVNSFILVACVLFFLQFLSILNATYAYGFFYKKNYLKEMISFVNKLSVPHKTLYVFAQPGHIGTPLIHYADISYVQRIDGLWVATDLFKKLSAEGDIPTRDFIKTNTDPRFFLNMIVDDFIKNKPDLVFIDESEINFSINGHLTHIDFLNYFKESPSFKAIWNHYTYLTTIKTTFRDVTIVVYMRIDNSNKQENYVKRS